MKLKEAALALILLSTLACSWGPKTNEYFCREAVSATWGEDAYNRCFVSTRIEEICSIVDGGYREECLRQTTMPWSIPDDVFRDTEKQHDYSLCPITGLAGRSICGDEEDTPAKEEAYEWFMKSRNLASDCGGLYAFCVGANYFAKRFFQPYQVAVRDPSCEEYFKSEVDEKIDSTLNWSVRGRCSFEYWEQRVGQKKKVTESQNFIINKNRVLDVLDGLVSEAEEIRDYGGVISFDGEGSPPESTTTLTETTSSTSSTTVVLSEEDKEVIEFLENLTDALNDTAKKMRELADEMREKEESRPPREPMSLGVSGKTVAGAFIALSLIVCLVFAVWMLTRIKSPAKKEDEGKKHETKHRKKRDHQLRHVKGIGKVAEDRLKSAGVNSLHKLVETEVDEIVEKTGITKERVSDWVEQARHLLE